LLVDSGTNPDFVSERCVERHNLHLFAALAPINIVLVDGSG
jgi:hypothetical protein